MHRGTIRHLMFWTGLLAAAHSPRAVAAQEGTWALTNVRILTVTGGTIDRGTVVIRDGLITAVGASVAVPAGARVLDLPGKTVSPGIIDLLSSIGAPVVRAPAGRGFGGGGGPPSPAAGGTTTPTGLDPAVSVLDDLTASAADVNAARSAGITAILAAHGRGAFRGRSALLPLHDSVTAAATIRFPVAAHLGYESAGFGQYPGSLMGVISVQRQTLYDAQRQAKIEARYAADPRGMARPVRDPGLEALKPVVDGSLPAFVAANRENEIRRTASLGTEFGLRLVVAGATEAWRATEVLTDVGVVVSVNYPQAAATTGWTYRGSRRHPLDDSTTAAEEARALIEGNAAALHRAGHRFALASGGTRGTDFVANVRKAISRGLPADVALAAMTIRAAELAGVDRSLGSIETGKIANLVITDRFPLADSAVVSGVFVDGRHYEVAPPPPERAGARGGQGRGAGGRRPPAGGTGLSATGHPAAGTWLLTLNSPQGALDQTMVLTADGDQLGGTIATQFGTLPITGRATGTSLAWSATMAMGGQSFDLAFDAAVAGERMTGTVTAGTFGSFPFSGVKQP